jgi:hypothetical protein
MQELWIERYASCKKSGQIRPITLSFSSAKKMQDMKLDRIGDEVGMVPINGQMVAPGYPRDNYFCTVFIGQLCPAICSAFCMCILALPYVVIPAVKGGGTQFCDGYWQNQTSAQLGGMVMLHLPPP